jgi:hypothetical protein
MKFPPSSLHTFSQTNVSWSFSNKLGWKLFKSCKITHHTMSCKNARLFRTPAATWRIWRRGATPLSSPVPPPGPLRRRQAAPLAAPPQRVPPLTGARPPGSATSRGPDTPPGLSALGEARNPRATWSLEERRTQSISTRKETYSTSRGESKN